MKFFNKQSITGLALVFATSAFAGGSGVGPNSIQKGGADGSKISRSGTGVSGAGGGNKSGGSGSGNPIGRGGGVGKSPSNSILGQDFN